MLTKQEAIKYHREMWNWIAEQYENGSEEQIEILKNNFTSSKYHRFICCNCYCCEYAENIKDEKLFYTHNFHRCYYCPVIWGNEKEADEYYKTEVAPFNSSKKPYYCIGYSSSIGGLFGKISKLIKKSNVELKRKEIVELAKQIANLEERKDV